MGGGGCCRPCRQSWICLQPANPHVGLLIEGAFQPQENGNMGPLCKVHTIRRSAGQTPITDGALPLTR